MSFGVADIFMYYFKIIFFNCSVFSRAPLLFSAASSLEVSRKLLFAWLDQLQLKFPFQSQLPNEQTVFTTQTFNFHHNSNLDRNMTYTIGSGQ